MGTHHFQHLLGLCGFLLLISQGYSDLVINSKAVLQKCTDQWTLQETQHVPRLSKMTVCLDLRLLTKGKWMAFSYTIPRSPSYELSLQGDTDAVYAWLQGVQHRFPVRLTPEHWHRLCLRIDSVRKRLSLSVNGSKDVHERMVVVKALRPSGNLQLGFHPWEFCQGSNMATFELHLFRIWGDVREHSDCEDGTVVGWDSNLWRISRGQTWVQDNTLSCKHYTTTTNEAPVANSTIRSTTTHKSATNTSATTSHTSSMGKTVKSITDTPKGTQSSRDSAKSSSALPSGVTSMKSISKVTQPTKRSSSSATSVKYTTPTSKGTQPTKSPSTMASTVTSASSYLTPYPKGSTSSKGSTFKPSSAIVTVPGLIKTSTSSAPLIKDATTNPSPTKALARVTNVSMTTTKAVTTSNAAHTTRQASHTSVSTPSTTTKAVIPSNGITKDNTRNIIHNTTSNVAANNTTRNKSENTALKTSTPRKTNMDATRTTIHSTG